MDEETPPEPIREPAADGICEWIAYLTAPSGRRYQVLNEAGDDWDEAATYAAYNAGEGAAA